MKADWHTCRPTPCPLCAKVVNYVRFEKDAMRTLFCGCLVTREEWDNVYQLPTSNTVTKSEATLCQWCGTIHVPGKGCSA